MSLLRGIVKSVSLVVSGCHDVDISGQVVNAEVIDRTKFPGKSSLHFDAELV